MREGLTGRTAPLAVARLGSSWPMSSVSTSAINGALAKRGGWVGFRPARPLGMDMGREGRGRGRGSGRGRGRGWAGCGVVREGGPSDAIILVRDRHAGFQVVRRRAGPQPAWHACRPGEMIIVSAMGE